MSRRGQYRTASPTLVVLDFEQGVARRYVPKVIGGFFREEGNIADESGKIGHFGGPEGLELVERFRTGKMPHQQPRGQTEDEGEVA